MQLSDDDGDEGTALAAALLEAVDEDPVLVTAAEDRAHVVALAAVTATAPALQQMWGIPYERSAEASTRSSRSQHLSGPLGRMVAMIQEPMRNVIFVMTKGALVPLDRMHHVLQVMTGRSTEEYPCQHCVPALSSKAGVAAG
jgi:hypothetical protein